MLTLYDLLKKTAARAAEKVAIRRQNGAVLYKEYLEQSSLLARHLERGNYDLKKPFLILISDTELDLYAFMAVAAIGGFYVPLHHETAEQRVRDLIADYEFAAILSSSAPPYPLEGRIELDAFFAESDSSSEEIYEGKRVLPTSPAFGLFTSGSSGKPKLVLKSHSAILQMCACFVDDFAFTSDDIFCNQVSFEFDSSCKSIFLSLYCGATICLLSPKDFMFPKQVIDRIDEYGANILIWSTFAFRILANFKAFSYRSIPTVKKVMLSGERIPENAIRYWMEHLDADYYNLYAPTEYSFNCLCHKISEKDLSNIPMGRELSGAEVFLLNEEGGLCEAGEEGELYLKGLGLALGYYRNPEQTASHFVQNPLHRDYPDIVYRSGDYGVRSEEGLYYFKGRIDKQIKIQGYRVELGEIEHVANGIAGVDVTCAIFDAERQRILLYYVGEAAESALYATLKKTLPAHLLPKRLILLEEMPLNKNNKIDRLALAKRKF